MAINQKRRQKKLEKKRAKHKAERKELARCKNRGLTARLSSFTNAPVLHSLVTDVVWEQGIGSVLLSRQLNNGQVALANLLVDVYCLGVKNVHVMITDRLSYQDYLARLLETYSKYDVSPEHLRKLVESAVEYAAGLGFSPHPDYHAAKLLFGDIDTSNEPEFEFGREGKPFFVSGPYDTPARCREVISTLTHSCGQGNFDSVLAMQGRSGLSEMLLLDEDDLGSGPDASP